MNDQIHCDHERYPQTGQSPHQANQIDQASNFGMEDTGDGKREQQRAKIEDDIEGQEANNQYKAERGAEDTASTNTS